MGHALKDALLKNTGALPSAASTTVDVAPIDLGHGTNGDLLVGASLKVTAPAVNTTMAPDTRTFTYSVIHSDNADLSGPTVLYSSVIVQTGAGGAGAAAASATVALPEDIKRYVGTRVVSGASTTTAAAVSVTNELLL